MGPNSPTLSSLPPEIVTRICQIHLLDWYKSRQSDLRCDLTALALTCHSLTDVVFDTLWNSLSSVAPLLRTLPEDLCTTAPFIHPPSHGNYNAPGIQGTQLVSAPQALSTFVEAKLLRLQVILRAPVRQDFDRFVTYARHVKKIGRDVPQYDFLTDELRPSGMGEYTLHSFHRIPSAVWDFLSEFAPKPLLPNVQFLHHWEWEVQYGIDYRETIFHPADVLFGPNLKEAEIHCTNPHAPPEHLTDLVRTLSGSATALEHLRVEADSQFASRPDSGSLHGPELRCFHQLTSFVGNTVRVAPDALLALGRLPHLELLLLHVDSAEYTWDAFTHERSPDVFPALQQLVLHKISFDWCTAFLRVLSCASLRGLSVRSEHHELPPPLLLEELCIVISELPSAHIITGLFITIGATQFQSERYDLSETYWPGDIAPLFTTLSALQRLDITGQCVTIIDDPTLDKVSQKCPDIVELTLAWDPEVHPGFDHERSRDDDDFPYATPCGLLHLARRCSRLTRLALAVNMGHLPPPSRTAGARRGGLAHAPPLHVSGPAVSPLQTFIATGSLVGDKARTASILSLLFPRLSEISNRLAIQGWWDISQYHSRIVRVRTQERACAEREGKRMREPDFNVELGQVFGLGEEPVYG